MARNRTEEKREAFKRLGSQRTNAVLERLRILGNCANRQLYDYTDEDVRRIFNAIRKELRSTEAKFLNSQKPEFEL
jgi:hypothetical protein